MLGCNYIGIDIAAGNSVVVENRFERLTYPVRLNLIHAHLKRTLSFQSVFGKKKNFSIELTQDWQEGI